MAATFAGVKSSVGTPRLPVRPTAPVSAAPARKPLGSFLTALLRSLSAVVA
jgi:hypothetical protein